MSSEHAPLPGQKYAMLVTYRGTAYCGWQRQKGSAAEGGPAIQASLEDALASITLEKCSVVGSGRTDSGVHAIGQVAHFRLQRRDWDPKILKKAIQSQVPPDIRVIEVRKVPIDFHAQRSAEKKQYSYYFQQGPCAIPHVEPYSWWIRKALDQQAMQQALDHLKGEHDFKPFQSSGAAPMKTTVRRILEAQVSFEPVQFPHFSPEGSGFVRIRLVGTGFLKQMVRSIAGTLLEVGEGRRDPDSLREILEKLDRKAVGPTAPARALWLEKVWYPKRFSLDW